MYLLRAITGLYNVETSQFHRVCSSPPLVFCGKKKKREKRKKSPRARSIYLFSFLSFLLIVSSLGAPRAFFSFFLFFYLLASTSLLQMYKNPSQWAISRGIFLSPPPFKQPLEFFPRRGKKVSSRSTPPFFDQLGLLPGPGRPISVSVSAFFFNLSRRW